MLLAGIFYCQDFPHRPAARRIFGLFANSLDIWHSIASRKETFLNNKWSAYEKVPLGVILILIAIGGFAMLHSAYTWPAEFIRSNSGDQHSLRGVVVDLGNIENYSWHYHYQIYDLRRDEPHSPSIGVVQLPEAVDVSFGLAVYPVQLDGANQGYVGFVARSSESISQGTRVVCGLGRIYYPTHGRSKFAFWLECQQENGQRQLQPIHECKVYNSHYVLFGECPDEESYNRRRTMPQWW